VPLLTNVVVRSLGIILLLAPRGRGRVCGGELGLPRPELLFTWFAVGVALTQVFLPFMVLRLYDVLEGQERRLDEAAAGLGAGPALRFWPRDLPSRCRAAGRAGHHLPAASRATSRPRWSAGGRCGSAG
jgi:putative spermidine/putrescine transport system permease protein